MAVFDSYFKKRQRLSTDLLQSAMLFVLAIVVSVVWSAVSAEVLIRLVSGKFSTPGRVLALGVFFGIGYGLFKLRQFQQSIYGAIECIFAMAAAWTVLGQLTVEARTEHVVGLIAAGYVLVRGLTNYREGQSELIGGPARFPLSLDDPAV
jgi:hypothetical protein